MDSKKRTSPQLETRMLTLHRHTQFLIESILLVLLGAAIWYAIGAGGLNDIDRMNKEYYRYDSEVKSILIHAWTRFSVVAASGFLVLLIIYYATSYEITPLRLIVPFLRTRIKLASEDSPKSISIGRVSSEDILNKAADVEIDEIPMVITREKEDKVVERILRESAHSAAKLAIKMERQINTHLILGVLVGTAGLAVWWFSFHIGFEVTDKTNNFIPYIEQAIPRITILLFIELLAGFFLRQYRIGVEDLKYFLELRRRADAKRIAYAIYALADKDQTKIDFADAILKEQSDTRLASGETTTALKAMEQEKNEMMEGITTLADRFEKVAKALKNGK